MYLCKTDDRERCERTPTIQTLLIPSFVLIKQRRRFPVLDFNLLLEK